MYMKLCTCRHFHFEQHTLILKSEYHLAKYESSHTQRVYHTIIIYCEVSCWRCWQKKPKQDSGSSWQNCASQDLLRETRNVISCISINPAWAVKPFQCFVSPTVIPANGTESRVYLGQNRKLSICLGIFNHKLSLNMEYVTQLLSLD